MIEQTALTGACAIGKRLMRQALWSGDQCVWDVVVPDESDIWAGRPTRQLAGPALYQGTAGIALFFAELFAVTADFNARRYSEGAIRYARAHLSPPAPSQFGFHTGRIGVAYVCARLATITGDGQHAEAAAAILDGQFGLEHLDSGLDVIAGAAGAVPALLLIDKWLGLSQAVESAVRLGSHLVNRAQCLPAGWAWPIFERTAAAPLTGLGHGAAGCGHALLELAAATGNSGFRYAAARAFAYEASVFDAASRNWPDFRNHELDRLISTEAGRLELRRGAARGGPRPGYTPHYNTLWCHGAAGIGLTRLRAYELTNDEACEMEARIAVDTTMRNLDPASSDCLCHGTLGNCETLLTASSLLRDSVWRNRAEEVIQERCERCDRGETWRCGTVGRRPDPSLMLGEAGIGHFLLRLHSPTTVPSVLLLKPVPTDAEGCTRAMLPLPDSDDLARRDVNTHFGRTLRIFDRLKISMSAQCDPGLIASHGLHAFAASLTALTSTSPEPLNGYLADALVADAAAWELNTSPFDASEEVIDEMLRPAGNEVDWDRVLLVLSRSARLARSSYDWDEWLEGDGRVPPALAERPIAYLLTRSRPASRLRLSPFTELVLSGLAIGGSMTELTRRASRAVVSGTGPDPEASIAAWAAIQAQLRACIESGIARIEVAPFSQSPK